MIHDSDSEQIEFEDDIESLSGKGVRMLEMEGLQAVLQEGCKCKKFGRGPMEFWEELYRRERFMTHPFLFCVSCSSKILIQYKDVGSTKKFEINQNSIIANKCASGTYSSLNIFCTMQGLPPPVSASNYRNHAKAVDKAAITQAQASMKRAILEVREHCGVEPEAIADILISCDGTWQKRGFTSLYGAVFIIAYETGKVLDYTVMCKYCKGCMNWEQKDRPARST